MHLEDEEQITHEKSPWGIVLGVGILAIIAAAVILALL